LIIDDAYIPDALPDVVIDAMVDAASPCEVSNIDPATGLPVEVCDGLDNNCDGVVDNILRDGVEQICVVVEAWRRFIVFDNEGAISSENNSDEYWYLYDGKLEVIHYANNSGIHNKIVGTEPHSYGVVVEYVDAPNGDFRPKRVELYYYNTNTQFYNPGREVEGEPVVGYDTYVRDDEYYYSDEIGATAEDIAQVSPFVQGFLHNLVRKVLKPLPGNPASFDTITLFDGNQITIKASGEWAGVVTEKIITHTMGVDVNGDWRTIGSGIGDHYDGLQPDVIGYEVGADNLFSIDPALMQ